jgi:hypothetical protein
MGKIQRRNKWFLFLLGTYLLATQFVLELPACLPISVTEMAANTVIPLECFKA